VANRRISEFSSIPGLDIDEQDLLTLVHVFEVDPVLRNKKITFTEFKNYLDLYYPSTAGGTFSGNVLINGNLTVTGTSNFTTITSANLATFSGIVVQNNAIVTGTVSGNTVTGNALQGSTLNAVTGTFSTIATGTTAAFTTGTFVTLTGTTTQGTSAAFTNGTFTNLTGTTITGTTVNATSGNFQNITTSSLNLTALTVGGLTVTGDASFASGVTVTGTLSGTTVTGTSAQFSSITGVSGVFTTQVSGGTVTGNSVLATVITGISGTFTTSVSGATVTGGTGAFSNITGISGVFTQRISGATVTGDIGLFGNVTGVSGVFTTQVSGTTITGNTINATFLNVVSGDFGRVSGINITGATGVFTSVTGATGTFTSLLSGTTVTGGIGQFTSLTGVTSVFTTSVSGATVTGNTVLASNLSGIAGVFTTSVSGATITGNTIQGTSGVFQNISGNAITGTTITANLVQAVSGAFTNIVFINTVISGDLRVLGSGYIVSGLEVSGQISGYTVTATGGNFTSLTGTTTTGTTANFASGVFTTQVSGLLVTGVTVAAPTGTFTSLTGTTIQGTTATYTTGSFTSLTGTTVTGTTASFTSGVFTNISGTTATITSGIIASGTAAAPSLAILADLDTGLFSPGANQLAVATNGTGRLFVDASGNIQIQENSNTVSTGASLYLFDTAGAAGSGDSSGRICFYSSDSTDGPSIRSEISNYYENSSADSALLFKTYNGTLAERLRITSAGQLSHIGGGSSGSPAVGFNGSAPANSLVVDSLGKVGIGTSTPAAVLDTVAAASFDPTNNSDFTGVGLFLQSPVGIAGDGNFGSALAWSRPEDNSRFKTAIAPVQEGSDQDRQGLAFFTANGIASPAAPEERLRISNAGNVGIGSTAPTSNLSFGATDAVISADTDSALDNKSVTLTGGGANAITRGGYIQAYGNEYTTTGGAVDINSGNVANSFVRIQGRSSSSDIRFWINASEAGRFDSSGRLLVGTSSSSGQDATLQVVSSECAQFHRGSTSSGAGTLSFSKSRNTSYGSFTIVQAEDRLGSIAFRGDDGTDYVTRAAEITAFVDGTPGSNDMPGRLVFSTTADGAADTTEGLRIDASQVVWLSNAFLSAANFATTGKTRISNGSGTNTGAVGMESYASSTATRHHISFSNPNGVVGSISTNTSATAYNTSSDYRLKENVVDLDNAIDRLRQLPVRRFNFIADPDTLVDGFLAHEVQDIVPEAITGEKDAVDDEGNPVFQGIDQSKLVPLLTAALQEAISEIESLKARLTAAGI
jgi:hypothetical protein